MKTKQLFAVLRLNKDIEIKNTLTGKVETFKIDGIAGYIPVFDTLEEANKFTQNGKYQISVLEI